MKTFKITQIIIFVIIFRQIAFAQNKYYTIEQIKDTLTKYENPYAGFSKLKLYKIPIGEFKKDSFLLGKANDLLNLTFIKDLCYHRKKHTTLNWYNEYNKKGFIIKYIKKSKKISYAKSKLFYDSIADNEELLNKYFNEALKEEIIKDSIECYSYDDKMTFSYYITFHSRLMTQTSYDTIRSYYDRYYKNFNEDKYFGGGKYDAVIIALINMGDPEIREKYNTWFDKKVKNKEIYLNEYIFLTKEIKGSLKYKNLAKLLFLDYFVIFDSEGNGSQLNGYTVCWDFPFIDTLSFKENSKIRDKMLGNNYSYYDKKTEKVFYNPKTSYEDFYKYYMDYVAYLEKKEKLLFDKIKYKTSK